MTSDAVVDVDLLATEQVRSDLADLDQRSAVEIVDVLLAAEAEVPAVLRSAREAIAAAAARVETALGSGGRLIYLGAGTPGRLAALDAAECPPTFGIESDRVVAILAGGAAAAGRSVEGAEDDPNTAAESLAEIGAGAGDVIVGISASGRTPYVLAGLAAGRAAGAETVAIVNNEGAPAREHADVVVELPTGPEVVAGSTRLTAGTAQKVALNAISTAAMVRLGKTYGPWMVDVVASNEKLRRRARRLIREIAGVDDAEAVAALDAAGWRTKTALVSVLAGVDAATARARLDANAGRVRDAIAPDATSTSRPGAAPHPGAAP
jgi:N-acetylmuramic acid 6-phosphate etherase